MIDRPCYFSFEKFKVVVTNQWLRTDFGYRQIDIQDAATAGWTNYMLKLRQKTSLRVIDRLRAAPHDGWKLIFLKGNHDAMMVEALCGKSKMQFKVVTQR